ncbi:MAG TPA: amino acid ABC transporter substrate-binding protein [Syntrophorhabdales bacterium]|nr:amino acid ABC transporter substrate-binding protein [Syntrophorhabdales bacterium]
MKNRSGTIPVLLSVCFVLILASVWILPGVCRAAEPKEIVVGTPVSRTGPGAPFGLYMEWGYNVAVADVNKRGGIFIKKYNKKLPVKLVLYDDESTPEKATQAVQRLILKDKVHALFSTGNPMNVIPCGMIAEKEGVPMSSAGVPVQAFLAGKPKAGWTWVWDIFFDELEMTKLQFLTMNTVQSNKKVALFTDNTPDGTIMGGLWKKTAPEMGYNIMVEGTFPVGTNEFGDMIRRAKEAGADIVIAQMLPPDTIALWKQMRSLGYKPKAAFFEKGGEPVEWWEANGQAAQGTMTAGFWHPALPYPGAKEHKERFEKDKGMAYSQHIADWYTAGRVMLDAIENAASLDPKAINDAMGKTNKTYEAGPVKYDKDHVFRMPCYMLQWQNGKVEIVYPQKLATAKLIYPLP